MKTATATVLAALVLLAAGVASAHETAGIVEVRISTVAPKRPARLGKHRAAAPVLRTVWDDVDADGCVTRTLAGDGSGQRVRVCADEPATRYDPTSI